MTIKCISRHTHLFGGGVFEIMVVENHRDKQWNENVFTKAVRLFKKDTEDNISCYSLHSMYESFLDQTTF